MSKGRRRAGGRPPESLSRLLSRFGPATVAEVRSAIAWAQQMRAAQHSRLSNAALREQARRAAAAIQAAHDCMATLDPYLDAALEELWWPSVANRTHRKPFLQLWTEQAEPWLTRATAVLQTTAKQIPAGRKGRRADWLNRALMQRLTHALHADSETRLTKTEARGLAAEVARSCGIDVSERRAVGRK